jgi:hypothetical protein
MLRTAGVFRSVELRQENVMRCILISGVSLNPVVMIESSWSSLNPGRERNRYSRFNSKHDLDGSPDGNYYLGFEQSGINDLEPRGMERKVE